MKTSDGDLLQSYVHKRDHKAFEQLVKNYIQIAYSAAITDLKCPDLAKDATQLTFLELSKKAPKLTSEVKLGGWVFVTARNISRSIRRGESRRAERERLYQYIDQMKSTPEPDWEEIRPEIHAALAEIKPIYRDVIIMRFFQGKDFKAMGKALNISADTARMRLNRGLEKMNARLAKKGIRSTASALGVALPAHAMTSVPSGLALSISNTIATGSAVSIASSSILTSTLTLMNATTITACAVAATAITVTAILIIHEPDAPNRQSGQSQTAGATAKQPSQASHPNTQSPRGQSPRSDHSQSKPGQGGDAGVGIDPVYLKKAGVKLAMIEKMLPIIKSQMADEFSVDLPNPAKQLQQRIGLDQNTTDAIEGIIAAHNAAEKQRAKDSAARSMELVENLFADQREEMLHSMAFAEMAEAGQTLTKEQEAYETVLNQRFESELKSTLGESLPEDPQEWYQSEATMAQIEAVLNADQGREIQSYAREQQQRKNEEVALERTNDLSNALGLDNAERDTLHQFLIENPDASNAQISEIISPELRALLPEEKPGAPFSIRIGSGK